MRTTISWRHLLEQAIEQHAHLPQARFVQLATIRRDGRPANRTLAFRGWLEPEECLLFTTDLRSAKVRQLGAWTWAEACWYFTETREQFRLLGQISVETAATGGARAAATRQSTSVGILVLLPTEVEYRDLRARPHLRRLYRRVQHAWTDVVVNP